MSNTELYLRKLRPAITALPSGYVFRVRELLPNPPGQLGVMTYRDRIQLGIKKVQNTVDNVNLWMKI